MKKNRKKSLITSIYNSLRFNGKYRLKNVVFKLIAGTSIASFFGSCNNKNAGKVPTDSLSTIYELPTIPAGPLGDTIRYGRDVLLNTAHYIGPNGTTGKYLGNKMNCTNCHLDAGTRFYGLNFFNTYKKYPQYRGRENRVLSLADRINNCIERPHNGVPLPDTSKEIKAIIAYLKWLSENADTSAPAGNIELSLPFRAADPVRGATVYTQHCASCHAKNGEGMWNKDSSTYVYPPLWGPQAYQKGSSPHRVLMLARFIKANMPYKIATWQQPLLTDEQAIDVAAFINDDSFHPRPDKKGAFAADYPLPSVKPIDYPQGPYSDSFSEASHKYGPWLPIIEQHERNNLKIIY